MYNGSDFQNRPYLYGQLNKIVEQATYNFQSSDSIEFVVNGKTVSAKIASLLPNTCDDGTYILKAIKNGNTVTYSWVEETN